MSPLEQYTPAAQAFVLEHLKSSVSELALKSHGKFSFSMAFVLDQIKCRQKLKTKVPEWYNHPDLIFPDALIGEQCSSSITAEYKANLAHGEVFVDLTGGLGVDTYYFSKRFKKGIYVEPDRNKLNCVQHNFQVLGVNNVKFVHSTAEIFLERNSDAFDLIYVDPSRRVEAQKVIGLDESVPDVTILNLEDWGRKVIIKTSPVMDVAHALKSLNNVSEVHAISIKNDCKEVLYTLEKGSNTKTEFWAVNYSAIGTEVLKDNKHGGRIVLSEPLNYIYEPNASIMKLGLFNSIIDKFQLKKLNQNTHIFTSNDLILDFPGRKFKLNNVTTYDRKSVSKVLYGSQANITTRNFSDSVDQVRKKLKLKDGGNHYLFATTLSDDSRAILICEKV